MHSFQVFEPKLLGSLKVGLDAISPFTIHNDCTTLCVQHDNIVIRQRGSSETGCRELWRHLAPPAAQRVNGSCSSTEALPSVFMYARGFLGRLESGSTTT